MVAVCEKAPPQAVLDLLDQPLYQNAFATSTLDLPQGYFFSHLSINSQLNTSEAVTFYVHSWSRLCLDGKLALCIASHIFMLQCLASLVLCKLYWSFLK